MATKKVPRVVDYTNPPETLKDHPFFGLRLNDEQIIFRDAIWNKGKDIVLCNAKAGTGKTLIAVATAVLMHEYDLIDEVVYISAAGNYEMKQGLLPGTIEEKSFQYQIPLRQALIKLGYNPDQVILSESNMATAKTAQLSSVLSQIHMFVDGTAAMKITACL